MNLASLIVNHPADRPALIDGDQVITYGQLRASVAAIQQQIVDAGFGRGDRIVLAAGNEPLFAAAAFAIMGAGATVVPVNPFSPILELKRKLESVSPSLILVGEEGHWILAEGDILDAPKIDMTNTELTEAHPEIVECDEDNIAFMLLTSGVSGDSKVAMLSHRNLDWVQESITGPEGLNADDVTLGSLPFAHIFGLNAVLLTSLRLGAKVVLQRRFDVDESLRLIRQHQVTSLTGAPPMWQRWATADAPDDSLRSITHATSGAAFLPIDTYNAIKDRYGVEIGEGYGLTETSPVVSWSRGNPIKPTSVGKPLAGVEVVLVEADGTPVDEGDTGEIVVRSPGVFKGYLDAPEVTNQVLTEDGWFWTGDVGVFDSEGYLYLVDRVKDLIIVSGFNVYPADVENVIMEHPDVRGAVVVGTPHGMTGEAVVAHVSGDVSETDLDPFVRKRLAGYKCPTKYHFVDDLPIAPTGKLIRRELR
nr:putative AMP-binding protein [uncultured bacterium]